MKIDDVYVSDFNSDQITSLLKGVPGSSVTLVVKRQGAMLNFDVKREKIIVNPVPHFQMVTPKLDISLSTGSTIRPRLQ